MQPQTGNTEYIRSRIKKYIKTILQTTEIRQDYIVNRLSEVCRLQKAAKLEVIELPGSSKDGRIWLSLDAMTHSYFYCEQTQSKFGRLIWKKNEPMLSGISLFDDEDRIDCLQIIESGELLSISYPDFRLLMNDIYEIRESINPIVRQNKRIYIENNRLLNLPGIQRVAEFEKTNKLFCHTACNEIKAMHIGLTRQTYETHSKKLKQVP